MNNSLQRRRAPFRTECIQCHKQLTDSFYSFCPDCGAMSDVIYDLAAVELRDSPNPYHRFIDLLPVRDSALLPHDARYTPTVHAERLGAKLGMSNLYLKNETVLPTSTTKDRMAAISLAYLYECGVRQFATSSTGNSSTAYAAAIARIPALLMYVFTAASFRERLALPSSSQIADIVLNDGSFVDASAAAADFARMHGIVPEAGFFNPGRREGLKLAWLEASEQVAAPIDWYVQAVSSAMGMYGVYKAASELRTLGLAGGVPRLLGVQQDSCAPMVTAWSDRSGHIRPSDVVQRPAGIAPEILRGDPTRAYPEVRRIVIESNGTLMTVSEAEIREARRWVGELENIRVGFAAAAAVAGVAKARRRGDIARDETVLVNLTGGYRVGTPATEATQWVDRMGSGWNLASVRAPQRFDVKAAPLPPVAPLDRTRVLIK
jgi:threonine synthase